MMARSGGIAGIKAVVLAAAALLILGLSSLARFNSRVDLREEDAESLPIMQREAWPAVALTSAVPSAPAFDSEGEASKNNVRPAVAFKSAAPSAPAFDTEADATKNNVRPAVALKSAVPSAPAFDSEAEASKNNVTCVSLGTGGTLNLRDPQIRGFEEFPGDEPIGRWASQLCWSFPLSHGTFLVDMQLLLNRTSSQFDTGGREFSASNWTRAAASSLGPDELELGIDGPEVFDVPQLQVGRSSYRFRWWLTIPGAYRMYLAHHREDYVAVEEVTRAGVVDPMPFPELLSGGAVSVHPPGHGLVLLAFDAAAENDVDASTEHARVGVLNSSAVGGGLLPLCAAVSGPDAPSSAVPWLGDLWGAQAAAYQQGHPTASASDVERAAALSPSWGRFVRLLPAAAGMFGLPGAVYRPYPGREWWTNGRADVAWRPYGCRMQPVAVADARSCLAGRRLLLRGDSHMRVLFNHLLARVCGVPDAAQKGWGDEQCFDGIPACPGATVCLQPDPFCDAVPLPPSPPPQTLTLNASGGNSSGGTSSGGSSGGASSGGTADWLVLNCGQHFAAASRVPLAAYRAKLAVHLSRLLPPLPATDEAAAPPVAARRLVWVTTHALPLRNDSFIRDYRDGRTHHRTRLLNVAAREVFAVALENAADAAGSVGRVSAAYVDVEASTQALSDLPADEAHFGGMPPVLDYHTDALLAAMGCAASW